MKKVTNTTKRPMFSWLLGGNPKAIEQQEAEGQKEITIPTKERNCIQLPLKINSGGDDGYERLGIKFKKSIEGDDLFGMYEVPNGFKTIATDHNMWNDLLNEKDEVVASFFYKAAYYDRDAFINFKAIQLC